MQFVQGRVGELKVSHLHYDNLLRKVDLVYPSWFEWLDENVYNAFKASFSSSSK